MGKPKIPRSGVYHGHFSAPYPPGKNPQPSDARHISKPAGPAHDAAVVEKPRKRMTPFISKKDYQFNG